MTKELAETVVVGLIDDDQSQIFKLNALVVQSVVQRFDHGYEAPVVVFFVEFLTLLLMILFGMPMSVSMRLVWPHNSMRCVKINTRLPVFKMYRFANSEKMTVFPPPVGSWNKL